MNQVNFKCSDCGEMHPISDIELTFRRPDDIAALPIEEIEERCQFNDDIYILDKKRYFVRGLIPLPVRDRFEPYSIGAWAEVSLESFQRIYDLWESDTQTAEPPFKGILANLVPGANNSLGSTLELQLTGPTTRPKFLITELGTELAKQQSHGISEHKAHEYTKLITG
jgi:hypothetical protein